MTTNFKTTATTELLSYGWLLWLLDDQEPPNDQDRLREILGELPIGNAPLRVRYQVLGTPPDEIIDTRIILEHEGRTEAFYDLPDGHEPLQGNALAAAALVLALNNQWLTSYPSEIELIEEYEDPDGDGREPIPDELPILLLIGQQLRAQP